MLNFLKNIFNRITGNKKLGDFAGYTEYQNDNEKFSLGAIPSESDVRTIEFAQVSAPVELPKQYKTVEVNLFTAFNQRALGTCVAHAFAFAKMVIDCIETNTVVFYSRRFLYVISRRFINAVNTNDVSNQGLPPIVTAKVITSVGVEQESGKDIDTLTHSEYVNDFTVTPEMRKNANIARISGFANVQVSPEALKQAILKTKVVPGTIFIDWNKVSQMGRISPPVKINGTHEVAFYGWEVDTVGYERILFRNSWGSSWGNMGNGYIYSHDLDKVLIEAFALMDIPNDMIERAKLYQYIFISDLQIGSRGDAVIQLQKRLIEMKLLEIDIPTGYFGQQTFTALVQYQKLKGITPTGNFGPFTRQAMNEDAPKNKIKSKMDLWIEAITKMEGAKPYRNNPGNIRFVGQQFAVNDNGYCKFDTFEHGYMALRNLLVRACTGQSKIYYPTMTLNDFYDKYAPDSDGNDSNNYAKFVAKYIGVPVSTQIKDLLA